jgi:hypothetical protein
VLINNYIHALNRIGKLCFQIVADLLSVLKMSATLSVFLGECGMVTFFHFHISLNLPIGVLR